MIGTASTIVHLAGALRRAAGRVIVTFFLTLIIVGVIGEAIGYFIFGHFELVTHILSAVLAVGWAIAISLLVLVGEVVRGLVVAARDSVKDVEKQVGDAGKLVGGVISSVEGHIEKK